MFWVIQSNIFSEHNYDQLLSALERLGVPYVETKIVPIFDQLLPADFDSHLFDGDIDEVPEVFVDESGPVMVSGSITLANIAKSRGWEPGSFLNENFDFAKWSEAFGEHLLNFDSIVAPFSEINPSWDEFFIRPCEDTKIFDGQVFTRQRFDAWRDDLITPVGSCEFAQDLVAASPTKVIFGEYRFFVVDGEIVTASQYKRGGKLYMSSQVDTEAAIFAQRMVRLWQPARAFVIDIADTSAGYKIIEINNINSAGFYDADVSKFVAAICEMTF